MDSARSDTSAAGARRRAASFFSAPGFLDGTDMPQLSTPVLEPTTPATPGASDAFQQGHLAVHSLVAQALERLFPTVSKPHFAR